MKTKSELAQLMQTEAAAGQAIFAKADAEGRDLNTAESAQVQKHLDTVKGYKRQVEDLAVRGAIADFGDTLGLGTGEKTSYKSAAVGRRSAWTKSTLDRIERVTAAQGVKALTTGTIDVAQPIETGIVQLPDTPTRVLELITDRQGLRGTNTFTFLRQSTRTDNADVVADDALKPTSIYTVTEVEGRCRVVAHLSEAFPKRYLDDHVELGDLLESEMERGLYLALEEQIVSGNGTGENFTGLLNTSGTLSQAWSSDLFTTLRKAVTTMAVSGESPTAWVINPADAEAIDLLSDNEARMYYDGPQQQLTTSPVWSVPVVQSLAVPVGTGLLADWRSVRLIVREGPTLDVDTSGDLFTHNQVKLRLEGRFGLALRRTTAVCEVDLAA